MHALGNDIVSLAANHNGNYALNKRFMEKVLLPHEQEGVTKSDFPEHMLWLIWSVKESAFKVCNQATGLSSFSPTQFEVFLQGTSLNRYFNRQEHIAQDKGFENCRPVYAQVVTPVAIFSSVTVVHDDYVHSCVYTSDIDPSSIRWGIGNIDDSFPVHQSAKVRCNATSHIARVFGIPAERMNIPIATPDASRVPRVFVNGTAVEKIQLTLSHHGHFVAYAFYGTLD